MYGILCVIEYKATGGRIKKYLKKNNEIRLFEDLESTEKLTQEINEKQGRNLENLKIYFKTIYYTTRKYTQRN